MSLEYFNQETFENGGNCYSSLNKQLVLAEGYKWKCIQTLIVHKSYQPQTSVTTAHKKPLIPANKACRQHTNCKAYPQVMQHIQHQNCNFSRD